jgi:hypothetical protein
VPDVVFRQEYLCQATEAVDAAFRYGDIEAALAGGIEAV